MSVNTLEEMIGILNTYNSSKITSTLIELIIAQVFQSNLFPELKFITNKSILDKDKFKESLLQARNIVLTKLSQLNGENLSLTQKLLLNFKKEQPELKKSKEVYLNLYNLIQKLLESDYFN